MTGSHVTSLRISSLKEFREKLASTTFTNEEVMSLMCEAEALHKRILEVEADNERLITAGDLIAELAWERPDDTVDLGRLRSASDGLRSSYHSHIPTKPVAMQTMLVRIMQKIMVDGSVTKTDEVFKDLSRLLHDAEIIE